MKGLKGCDIKRNMEHSYQGLQKYGQLCSVITSDLKVVNELQKVNKRALQQL